MLGLREFVELWYQEVELDSELIWEELVEPIELCPLCWVFGACPFIAEGDIGDSCRCAAGWKNGLLLRLVAEMLLTILGLTSFPGGLCGLDPLLLFAPSLSVNVALVDPLSCTSFGRIVSSDPLGV
jgi:hypothetical protein